MLSLATRILEIFVCREGRLANDPLDAIHSILELLQAVLDLFKHL